MRDQFRDVGNDCSFVHVCFRCQQLQILSLVSILILLAYQVSSVAGCDLPSFVLIPQTFPGASYKKVSKAPAMGSKTNRAPYVLALYRAKRHALSATAIPPVESNTPKLEYPLSFLLNGSIAKLWPRSSARCMGVLASGGAAASRPAWLLWAACPTRDFKAVLCVMDQHANVSVRVGA